MYCSHFVLPMLIQQPSSTGLACLRQSSIALIVLSQCSSGSHPAVVWHVSGTHLSLSQCSSDSHLECIQHSCIALIVLSQCSSSTYPGCSSGGGLAYVSGTHLSLSFCSPSAHPAAIRPWSGMYPALIYRSNCALPVLIQQLSGALLSRQQQP